MVYPNPGWEVAGFAAAPGQSADVAPPHDPVVTGHASTCQNLILADFGALIREETILKKGYRQLLDEANSEIEVVSPEEAATFLGDPDTVFVDIRDPRERQRDGLIPEAFHCTRGMLEFWIDPESPYHKPVFASGKTFVFFCAGGWRSALATKTAQDMGLAPVKHILGGFTAWKAAGLPITVEGKA